MDVWCLASGCVYTGGMQLHAMVLGCALVVGGLGAAAGCGGGSAEVPEDGGEPGAGAMAGAGSVVAGGADASLDPRIESAGVGLVIPSSWEMRAPSRAMRDAEFVVRAPEGSGLEDAVGTVFVNIGGTVDANLSRWEGQLGSEDVREVSIERRTVEGRLVGVFRGTGVFDPGRQLGSTGPREGYMILGLVAETDSDKPIVVKLTGPREVLEGEAVAFEALVSSVGGAGVAGAG